MQCTDLGHPTFGYSVSVKFIKIVSLDEGVLESEIYEKQRTIHCGRDDGITFVFDCNVTFRLETFHPDPEGFVHNRHDTSAHKYAAIPCMQGEET